MKKWVINRLLERADADVCQKSRKRGKKINSESVFANESCCVNSLRRVLIQIEFEKEARKHTKIALFNRNKSSTTNETEKV